jgi:hypothetical protein
MGFRVELALAAICSYFRLVFSLKQVEIHEILPMINLLRGKTSNPQGKLCAATVNSLQSYGIPWG